MFAHLAQGFYSDDACGTVYEVVAGIRTRTTLAHLNSDN